MLIPKSDRRVRSLFFISASHANFTLSVKSIIDFNMPGFPLYRFKVVKYIVILANILIFCRFIVYSLKKALRQTDFPSARRKAMFFTNGTMPHKITASGLYFSTEACPQPNRSRLHPLPDIRCPHREHQRQKLFPALAVEYAPANYAAITR